MSYKLQTTPNFERTFKKLPPHIYNHLKIELFRLEENPRLGERLTGKLSNFWSLHVGFKGTQYRVLYMVFDDLTTVRLIYAASRENFYREIERLDLKRLTAT